ncbi:unnamed protein product [Closterium sp. NIES-65]|nr:unnamed protein product [Closterium sp. NIES-65]
MEPAVPLSLSLHQRSSRRCRRGRLNSRIDGHCSFSRRSLLASSPSHSPSLTFRIPAVPRASPPHGPHDRLAAAALKECAAEWGMSATGWARGAECAQAQAITCDGDGMVTSLDVAQRNLTGSLPFALSALSRLHSLSVTPPRRSLVCSLHPSPLHPTPLHPSPLHPTPLPSRSHALPTSTHNPPYPPFHPPRPRVREARSNVRSNQLSGPLPPALSTLARLRTLRTAPCEAHCPLRTAPCALPPVRRTAPCEAHCPKRWDEGLS